MRLIRNVGYDAKAHFSDEIYDYVDESEENDEDYSVLSEVHESFYSVDWSDKDITKGDIPKLAIEGCMPRMTYKTSIADFVYKGT